MNTSLLTSYALGRAASLRLAVVAMLLLVMGGCTAIKDPTVTRQIMKADTSLEFTTIDWFEGEHAANTSTELKQAIRSDPVNVAFDAALKITEKPMLDAKDPRARRLKGYYKIKAYDPGSSLLRAFGSALRLGKSEMIAEAWYEYEGKRLGHIEITTHVYFNDILRTIEQQQAEWFWGDAQEYWGDWLSIGSAETRKKKGL